MLTIYNCLAALVAIKGLYYAITIHIDGLNMEKPGQLYCELHSSRFTQLINSTHFNVSATTSGLLQELNCHCTPDESRHAI